MPLSEHEEQILAEIERQLAADDPKFAARTRRRLSTKMSRTLRVRIAAVLGFVGLLCVLMVGFVSGSTVASIAIGGVGLVMLFGAILLGISLLGQPPARAHSSVPPDERT